MNLRRDRAEDSRFELGVSTCLNNRKVAPRSTAYMVDKVRLIRIRAERRLGEMIAAQKAAEGLSKGAAGSGINQHTPKELPSFDDEGAGIAQRPRRADELQAGLVDLELGVPRSLLSSLTSRSATNRRSRSSHTVSLSPQCFRIHR